MKLLLDTHVWLWMQTKPARLSARARKLIVSPDTEALLSVASLWEIAIKYQIGRLPLPKPPSDFVPERLARQNVGVLPIRPEHAFRVAELPFLHRDPFDRLLIAQAQVEAIAVVTVDPEFRRYDVEVIRA
ncbi:MAG: type II toxin-antitoxin system VapC family toxin [Myxococcales bacterium]|nr:type II toxin-antitoxin system VapC family toxin [Myxococcales bacterium]